MNNPHREDRLRPNSYLSSAVGQPMENRFSQPNLYNNFPRISSEVSQNQNVSNIPQYFFNPPPAIRNFSPDTRNRLPPPMLTTRSSDLTFPQFRMPPTFLSAPPTNFTVGPPTNTPNLINTSAPNNVATRECSNANTPQNIPGPFFTPTISCRPPVTQQFSIPVHTSTTHMNMCRPPTSQNITALVPPPNFPHSIGLAPPSTFTPITALPPPPTFVLPPGSVNQVAPPTYITPLSNSALQPLNSFNVGPNFPPTPFPPNSQYPFPSETLQTQEAISTTSTTKSVEDTDKDWVEMWTSKKMLQKVKPAVSEMTVKQAKVALKLSLEALDDLRAAIGFLSRSLQADDPMWNFKLRKALKAKEQLTALKAKFNQTTVRLLAIRLKKIDQKRNRLKRQRVQIKENETIKCQETERLHQEIDAWRKGIQDNVLEQKKKEELKHEADNILSEVRKKLQEGRKLLEHLDLLENLRSVRHENAVKKGLKVSSESTERFDATLMKLRELMTRQLTVYETEERALKVMLETEREQERHDEQKRKVDAFMNCQKETIFRLFGTPPEPTSPLYFYWQFHMQGSSNLETLVQIRHQWDSFLRTKDDPLATPIPLGWVLPSEPSSETWKSAIASNDDVQSD